MKYLCYILALWAIALAWPVAAQQPTTRNLHFLVTSYDYGHVEEAGGVVVGRFEAVNRGDGDVEIRDVVTTCGCTAVRYDKGVIAPRDTFGLEVRYDPMNRPGRIERTIYVTTSEGEEPVELRITGYVKPRERTIDEIYPFLIGSGLRLDSNFRSFGYLEHGRSAEQRIGYVNTSERSVTLDFEFVESSGALHITAPQRIKPHASGDICLTYSLEEQSDKYGSLSDRVELRVDGLRGEYELMAYAIAIDNFDAMDDISAPIAEISKKIIKFGEVNRNSGVCKQSVVVHNGGRSDLMIRCAESSHEAVSVVLPRDRSIVAGGDAEIELLFDVARVEDWDNPFVARVSIITNDPIRPMQSLKVNALPE